MPKRSTGCSTCRRRKLRCDGQRPRCQRCLTYGIDCPGWPADPTPFRTNLATPIVVQKPVAIPRDSSKTDRLVGRDHPPGPHLAQDARKRDTSAEDLLMKQMREQITLALKRRPRGSLKLGWTDNSNRRDSGKIIAAVNDRPAVHIQLLSNFLDVHFPTLETKTDMVSRGSWLAALPDLEGNTTLTRASIDALSFAYTGSHSGDVALVRRSETMYGRALSLLALAVSRPPDRSNAQKPRAVIISIMMLSLFERFDIRQPFSRGTDWKMHYGGINQYLKAAGPFFNMRDPFDHLIVNNLRSPLLFYGIVQRQSVVLSEPQWLALTAPYAAYRNMIKFHDLAMPLPTLIELTDALLKSNSKPLCELEQHCKQLMVFIDSLDEWLQVATTRFESPTIYTISLHNPTSTGPTTDELHAMRHSMHGFSSLVVASYYVYYWIISMIARCTLLRILHFRPEIQLNIAPLTQKAIESMVYQAATDLCKGTHIYMQSSVLAHVLVSKLMLAVATEYFDEQGLEQELNWCRATTTQLRQRLDYLSAVKPKSLCQVGDVADDVARTMHFRAEGLADFG